MTRNFFIARLMRSRCAYRPGDNRGCARRCIGLDRFGHQSQPDLPPAGQFDIDMRQQLRVEQRAMLDPLRPVDAKARAQRIEAVLRARSRTG